MSGYLVTTAFRIESDDPAEVAKIAATMDVKVRESIGLEASFLGVNAEEAIGTLYVGTFITKGVSA